MVNFSTIFSGAGQWGIQNNTVLLEEVVVGYFSEWSGICFLVSCFRAAVICGGSWVGELGVAICTCVELLCSLQSELPTHFVR